ncbi:chemotaxis protein CheC [Vibrio anguillarum]|uniref:Chemotaxis protein CheC n=1 Tax=Vibrio anguillarum TaxID=55601 RepID=A0ABR9Z6A5_VIBAN|nr:MULTISPECIES: chemotaxis protein CheC [Vibrio]ASG01901.1 chemotaxis protein CheC [Vibrio anguillarum]MBF4245564.1 chemotaxis protein CheC [Vibrio anguillarum]MBF4373968.1 chemotaxis protein CheC [Vibrio anguillarum]MBT2948423.1 chemotaxis protein CheC [Vibrio anguillarum]MCS0353031.1 chemotaxis protein CheC [Vibrio ordalii]
MTMALSEDHKDALQEFMNISMGRAANKLATLLNLHVTISVPSIGVATDEDLAQLQSYEADYYYTRQSFFGGMDGELVTLMSRKGCEQIVSDLKQSTGDAQDVVSLEESILDISNILSGASLKGLCQQIDIKTKIQSPVLFYPSTQPLPISQWKLSLIMEISFLVEKASFSAKTIICFADNELDKVLIHLDELM